jgi:hypothetical protein
MRQRSLGWIMPEAEILSTLELIEQKIRSPKIDVRHQDVLIRLKAILENDLNGLRLKRSSGEREGEREKAA